MNIHMKSGIDKNPFDQSDRNHKFRTGAGKGDANRSLSKAFVDRFPRDMGKDRVKGKWRKVYR